MSYIYAGDTEMAITIRGLGWHLPDIEPDSGECTERSIVGDGLQALIQGAMMVMSGHYQRVLE